MDTQQHGVPGQPTLAQRPVSRRRFLGAVGLGAGSIAVAGAAGLTWYTIDGGVFATGTGPAYTPWDNWNPRIQRADRPGQRGDPGRERPQHPALAV